MPVEALVGPGDESAVEPSLTAARLVARGQQNGAAGRVEGEGDPPFPIRRKAAFPAAW